ncbi:DUF1295 domain-containing protein [Desulforhabdus sp. TSK]|uniref:DUF1295 domain-containing protein n=1 Tax=Desulforhabdus sp. TSK TaxID=2925014 RepID=UPI001FC89C41|nr:DUF1295 domain-containing protein [Desulforhabdus sp. TSK]GKT08709.1 hypothetical protein DSTSK_20140 [Desulforhabdus sp. TSK]
MTNVLITTTGIVLAYMTVWFILALIKGRNDIVDVAWGPGFILAALFSFLYGGMFTLRGVLVCRLVLVWGLRLALHIHERNRGKGEDHRYRQWREEWGDTFLWRSFLQIFMLQGVLLVFVAVPVIFINASASHPFTAWDFLGLAVWMLGFSFEAVGDWQLLTFMRDPANRGKLLTEGLWRYTRHPNYFGEVTLWWGIWLMALSLPYGWLTIIGPLTITCLILKVSGIPMLERHYEGRTDFEEYKKRTSPFFPLPPRTGRNAL